MSSVVQASLFEGPASLGPFFFFGGGGVWLVNKVR